MYKKNKKSGARKTLEKSLAEREIENMNNKKIKNPNEETSFDIIRREVKKIAKILEIPMPIINKKEGTIKFQAKNGAGFEIQLKNMDEMVEKDELVNTIWRISSSCMHYFMLANNLDEILTHDEILYNCEAFSAGYIIYVLGKTDFKFHLPKGIKKDLAEKINQRINYIKILADLFEPHLNLEKSWGIYVKRRTNYLKKLNELQN